MKRCTRASSAISASTSSLPWLRVELVEQLVQLGALGVGDPLGGAVRGVPLELRAHVGDVREVGDVDLRGERAAAREHRDEVLEREPLDRLAHRRAAHLELAAEQVLVDRRARRDPQRDDPVAQLDVRAIGQQLAGDAGAVGRVAIVAI